MKRILFSLCALALIVTSIGCSTCNCNSCRQGRLAVGSRLHGGCGPNGCGPLAGRLGRGCGPLAGGCMQGAPVPASAGVAYPYYTVRGPRDFLMSNPPSIGP